MNAKLSRTRIKSIRQSSSVLAEIQSLSHNERLELCDMALGQAADGWKIQLRSN